MDIDALIAKYLNKESTFEETDQIDRWRKSSSDNELIFNQSKDVWSIVKNHQAEICVDKGKTWADIRKKINHQYSLPVLLRVAGIAASIALMLGWASSHIFLRGYSDKISKRSEIITLYVPGGVCSKTVLSDSTVVWLNSSSMISYPSSFEGNTRTVELIGEAFFDVSRDETKPFIINSGSLKVNVLGTSFNFKHYEEDTHAVLAVESGMVTLSTSSVKVTTLEAGKYATVDNNSLQTKVYDSPQVNLSMKTHQNALNIPKMIDKETYTDQFSSWRDFKLVFRDESFGNVLNELSRRYNAEFEIMGDEIMHYIYTATFDNMSLEDVLNLLKISSPIDYSIKSNTTNNTNAYGKRQVTIFCK